MILKIAYIISVLSCYIPKFIETIRFNRRLEKEGFVYDSNQDFYIHQIARLIATAITSLIPVINIITGCKTIRGLAHFERTFTEYKYNLIYKEMIHRNGQDEYIKDLEDLNNMFKDTLDELNDNIADIDEIIKLLNYIDSKGYDIDEDFQNFDINEKMEYLKELKRRIEEIELNEEKNIINKTDKEEITLSETKETQEKDDSEDKDKPKKLVRK